MDPIRARVFTCAASAKARVLSFKKPGKGSALLFILVSQKFIDIMMYLE